MIIPVYIFHATCSPAVHFGITPVFCESLRDGTISPTAIADALTPKTKAVVVCHVWGIPCDMEAICSSLEQWPGVLLIEDCSHAHGAKNNGKAVGTFGDGAAWSLQGQKIVTGGEGGITVTKHADFHYRMLIFGHYNKRCKVEIPADHHLRQIQLDWRWPQKTARIRWRLLLPSTSSASSEISTLANQFMHVNWHRSWLVSRSWKCPSSSQPNRLVCIRHAFQSRRSTHGLDARSLGPSTALSDVDIPKSTGLLHREPLFNKPWAIFPHLYLAQEYSVDFASEDDTTARQFYDEATKLPVYATKDDQAATNRYIDAIMEVATNWMACTPTTTRKA